MFDLDQAISEWRKQMVAGGIKARDVLDELEGHLREDMRRRLKSGAGEERTFELAAQQIGGPETLKSEFIKVETEERKYMKRGLIITLGIIGVLVGMAFVMPAVAQYRHEGAMRNGEPWLFLMGSLLTLTGVGAAIRGGKKSRA
jgi:hypothetical protein